MSWCVCAFAFSLSLWARFAVISSARALERLLRMCNQRRWNWILLYLLWAACRLMAMIWYMQWMRASRRVFRQMKQVRYAWRRPTSYLICAKVCTLWHRGYVNDCVDDRRAARNWDAGELHATRPVLRKCHKICYSTLTIIVLHRQAEKYCLLRTVQKY
jgi:hypothetical protein